ncbi:hypothetical protein IAQ61_008500 [Plenodomus lingam]|uniref:uncharacterized protein n=1 Tax=Leptosphaeria maculans TaxID=5022 RepID=UPI003331D45A|nr:hypothetical protein IAQ61_008500 [Plenodomus lingam]
MAPFRNRDRSNRSGRGPTEHNVLEGLPISQYREAEITIGPNSSDNKPLDKDAWPELPMPRDSHLLPFHSQQLLRAARSGRTVKPPAPIEDDNEMKDEEEESKEMPIGFTVKKYVKVPRHLETPEPEFLAKRRKGLPSQYVNGQIAPALRETKVKKLDAEGNVAVYKVLVPEGQAVEGEVQPTDAAIEAVPATAAPGTIVEGVGVVNAEGVVVANDILHQTPPRRRPPPPKKKKTRGGPGRGRRKVAFAERSGEKGTPSNTGADLLSTSALAREDGSVVPSDGGDTPMADAGGEDDEGSGEEGSEDEDHDMERNSTPVTPLRLPSAPPTSTPGPKDVAMPDAAPAEPLPSAADPVPAVVETSEPTATSEAPVLPEAVPEVKEEPSVKRDASSSPDLPLSHSRHNSLPQVPTPLPTTDAAAPEPTVSEPTVSEPTVSEPTVSEPTVSEPTVNEPTVSEPTFSEPTVSEPTVSEPTVSEPTVSEPAVSTVQSDSIPAPMLAPEPVVVGNPVAVSEPEATETPPAITSAPPSEPDLLGSLERQLEKDSKEMAG